jgi:hypothetical protein
MAGHSNPRLAAICSERRRTSLLEQRQRSAAESLEQYFRSLPELEPVEIRLLARQCHRLGDKETGDRLIAVLPDYKDIDLCNVSPEPTRLAA